MRELSPQVSEAMGSVPMSSSYLTSHAEKVEKSPKGAIMSTLKILTGKKSKYEYL